MNSKHTVILFAALFITVTVTTLLIAFNDKGASYKPPTMVSQDEEHNRIINVADASFRAGNLKTALENYLKIHEFYPDNLPLKNRIGTLYMRLEQYNRAEKMFRELVEKVPGNGVYLVNLGVTLTYLKKMEEAQEIAVQALTLNVDDARIYFILAAAEALKNNAQTSVDQLTHIGSSKVALVFTQEEVFDSIRESEPFILYVQELKTKLGLNEQNPRP